MSTLALAELLLTIASRQGRDDPSGSFMVAEASGSGLEFDPVRGFHATEREYRIAWFNNGVAEYDHRGRLNAQRFRDRDDFSPKRTSGSLRIGVLGDSFTSAEHLALTWPDAVEDLARSSGESVELLNFAQGGTGLANWWSLVTRYLAPQDYELDALIFAVWGDNLERGFTVMLLDDDGQLSIGRAPSWDPDGWPRRRREARPFMQDRPCWAVSSQVFEETLLERRRPDPGRRWSPFLFSRIARLRERAPGPTHGEPLEGDTARLKLIEAMAEYAAERDLPVLVVRVPSRDGLLEGEPLPSGMTVFARALEARLMDGGEAFSDRSEAEIRADWLPTNGHWDQAGSDRFARWLTPILLEWLNGKDPGVTEPSDG